MLSIRRRRLTHGVTQAELAAAVGISREQVSKIESGYADPHISTLTAIADALECGLGDLVEGF